MEHRDTPSKTGTDKFLHSASEYKAGGRPVMCRRKCQSADCGAAEQALQVAQTFDRSITDTDHATPASAQLLTLIHSHL